MGPFLQLSELFELLWQQRPGVLEGRFGVAAEHPGDFLDALVFFKKFDFRDGSTFQGAFGDHKMVVCAGGHGGQVGDADDLVLTGNLQHFFADNVGCFAPNIGVDLIENKEWDFVFGSQNSL